jgi:hypothetical protein
MSLTPKQYRERFGVGESTDALAQG